MAILAYHGTEPDRDHPWWLDFVGQMTLVADLGYRVVSLADAVHLVLAGRPLREPTLALTFDDGWANNLRAAFPELARRGWPATVFLTTSYLGRRPYLLPEEIPRLGEMGIAVGNHGHGHADLTLLETPEILADLRECNRRLGDLVGRTPRHFCYPFGRYSPRVREAVATSGMEAACSGRVGFNRPGAEDPLVLRRLTLEPGDRPQDLRMRLAGGYDFLDRTQRIMDRGEAGGGRPPAPAG